MKVLFISTSLPPNADSQAIRSLYLLQGLTAPDWEWTFLTPSSETNSSAGFEGLIPSNSVTVMTEPIRYERWCKAIQNKLGSRALWVFKNLYYRLAIPDIQAGWQHSAVRRGRKLLAAESFDLIVSASGSATAHIAACKLSREFDIPWVADFGDPWHMIDRTHRPLVSPVSYFLEKAIVPKAKHLVFTTTATEQIYCKFLGRDLPPTTVLPYGYVAVNAPKTIRKKNRQLTAAHIGAAFVGNRNLIPTIQATSKLQNQWDLQIIGDHSSSFEQEVERLGATNVVFKERVSYDEAEAATQKADLLIIVGNKGGLQIPGKVFVCLGSSKPILYLAQRTVEEDPAAQLLSQFAGVMICDNDPKQISICMKEIGDNFGAIAKEAATRKDSNLLKAYEAHTLARHFADVLRSAA